MEPVCGVHPFNPKYSVVTSWGTAAVGGGGGGSVRATWKTLSHPQSTPSPNPEKEKKGGGES